jgi:hypothetical protein
MFSNLDFQSLRTHIFSGLLNEVSGTCILSMEDVLSVAR